MQSLNFNDLTDILSIPFYYYCKRGIIVSTISS